MALSLALVSYAAPASALCSALLAGVPDSVGPGEAIHVTWQATSSSAVPHTNIHYRLNDELTERPGPVFSFGGGAEVFETDIAGTGLVHGDDVHLRAHVRNEEGEDCFTPWVRVPVIDSTPPPVPDPDAFEPDDRCSAASPIVPGGGLQLHSISPPGDVDAVTFVGIVGVRYAVETRPLPTRGVDTRVEVWGPDGASVAADDNSGAPDWDARAEFVAEATGTYCAQVRAAGDEDGWYELRVRVLEAPACATALVAPPATASAAADLEMSWAALGGASIMHTNLHYMLPGDGSERGTPALAAPAGTHPFSASIPTATLAVGDTIRVRSHVVVGGGASCYSPVEEIVVTGGELCAVVLDDVPAQIVAGDDLSVMWSLACGADVPHANLHFSGHGGPGERPGPVHSVGAGAHQFGDILPVGSWPAGAVVHVRGHVRTGDGQDFYTPMAEVVIAEPVAPCETTLFSVPDTLPEGLNLGVQWTAQADDEIIHTNVHYRLQGETTERGTPVEQRSGLLSAFVPTNSYPAGAVLVLRSHVVARGGLECFSDERTVEIVPAWTCDAAISDAPAEVTSGQPVPVSWEGASPGPGRAELIWRPVGSWARVGPTREIAGAGEWQFQDSVDIGSPSEGTEIDIWPRAYHPGGRCEGPPIRVTVGAGGWPQSQAAAAAGASAQVLRVSRTGAGLVVVVAADTGSSAPGEVGLAWWDERGIEHLAPTQAGRGRFRAVFCLDRAAVRMRPSITVKGRTTSGTVRAP